MIYGLDVSGGLLFSEGRRRGVKLGEMRVGERQERGLRVEGRGLRVEGRRTWVKI